MKHISPHGTSALRPARQGRTGLCFLFARVVKDRCITFSPQRCGILSKGVFSTSLLIQVKVLVCALWDQQADRIAGVAR